MSDSDGGHKSKAKAIGESIGRGLAKPFQAAIGATKAAGRAFFGGIVRKLPFVGSSFWKGMIKFSVHQYQKAKKADVIAFSAEPHGIEPRACNWQEADPEEPEVRPGWTEVGGEKTWGPGAEGRDVERFGKADVIFADRAAHETATPLKMRFAEALDLEQVDGLIEGADVNLIEMWPQDPQEMGQSGAGSAVADGGMQRRKITVNAEQAGLKDAVVDLEGNFGDGHGMRVSARKYKDQYLNTTDVEEMQKQETRGWLAGLSGNDNDKIYKIAIMALLVVLAVALGPTIITALFGGGGGGGGSAIPLVMGAIL